MHSKRQSGRRAQRGDTMIEVLVTIIVIAIGVLGAAALQVTTLKNLSTSHSTTVAALIAEDLGERMRTNAEGSLNDYYVHSTPQPKGADCALTGCNVPALAGYDLGVWWEQMNTLLPAASGEVTRNPGTNTFVITVYWDEDRSGSSKKTCPPQTADDLECYRINVTI